MSTERKHGLPSEGELADDELEISGGSGDEATQSAAGRGVGQSPSGSGSDMPGGVEQKTGAGSAGWG